MEGDERFPLINKRINNKAPLHLLMERIDSDALGSILLPGRANGLAGSRKGAGD